MPLAPIALLVAACAPDGASLALTVDAAGPLPGLAALRVTVADGRRASTRELARGTGAQPPARFTLRLLEERTVDVTITVDALDGAGATLSAASVHARLDPGRTATSRVVLAAVEVEELPDAGVPPRTRRALAFAPPVQYPTGDYASDLAVADFDRDGHADAVAPLGAKPTLLHWRGRGDGTFAPPASTALPGEGGYLAAGDWNRDGAPDVAVITGRCDLGTAALRILLGRGDGRFDLAPAPLPVACEKFRGLTNLVVADWNGDGLSDLAHGDGATADIGVHLSRGDGRFNNLHTPRIDPGFLGPLAGGDFDGDGHPDLVAARAGVVFLRGRGDGTFDPPRESPIGGIPSRLAPSDWDGDGRLDLAGGVALGNGYPTRNVSMIRGRGDGTFTRASDHGAAYNDPGFALGADLDDDGRRDLVVALAWGYGVSIFPGSAASFLAPLHVVTHANPRAVAAVDLDEDGLLDLVAAGGRSGDLSVLLNRSR